MLVKEAVLNARIERERTRYAALLVLGLLKIVEPVAASTIMPLTPAVWAAATNADSINISVKTNLTI